MIGAYKNCVTMRGKINSCYRETTLTFLRRNLLASWQEVINSFRLFGVPKSGLQIIKYFSQRHTLQRLEAGLYGVAFFQDLPWYLKISFSIFQLPDVFTEFSTVLFASDGARDHDLLDGESPQIWSWKSFQSSLRRFGRVCHRWLIRSLGILQAV